MTSKIAAIIFLILLSLLATNCDTKELTLPAEPKTESLPEKSNSEKPHAYGGWYCPDNLRSFPAVDVKKLDQVSVVKDRLPTREETMTAKSLIYIDPVVHPNAKPLPMPLPRLARYYSQYTKKNELVVVIQALEIGSDSIVGFRFVNGGNGSARLNEVTFISAKEEEGLGSTPFVAEEVVIDAFPKIIWEVLTDSTYAKILGEMLAKNAYHESTWQKEAPVHLKYGPDKIASTGIITAIWKSRYIQIDYDFDGYHYVEKILFSKNKEGKNTTLHLTAGPFGEAFVTKQLAWHNWLYKVKELSERKMNLENYFGMNDQEWR